MKKSRYSDSQILAILKQAEAGTPVPALCREHGMSNCIFWPIPITDSVLNRSPILEHSDH